jgi:ABC-type lipoprotein export system ATPase subunit
LTLAGVGHAFAGRPTLFSGLDLVLTEGSVTAVTGPSGSGKSTLLHIAAGWQEPTWGCVDRSGLGRVQWVFQNPHGVARRSVADHVVLPLLAREFRRPAARGHAETLLASFGLQSVADRKFGDLSGGEALRLMLARAIAAAPDLLLVDEPTAQLDSATAMTVTNSLDALAGRGAVVVVATHDIRTRDACTDHVDLGRYR